MLHNSIEKNADIRYRFILRKKSINSIQISITPERKETTEQFDNYILLSAWSGGRFRHFLKMLHYLLLYRLEDEVGNVSLCIQIFNFMSVNNDRKGK